MVPLWGLGEGGGDIRGVGPSSGLLCWEGSLVIWRYSSVLAAWMSSLAPLPKASSRPASFLTRLTRMGVRAVPSRSSRPCKPLCQALPLTQMLEV